MLHHLFAFASVLLLVSADLVTLKFSPASYSAHIGAKNFTLICHGVHMRRVDVVWLIFSIHNSQIVRAIYSDKKYIGNAASKYHVNIAEDYDNDTLTTSLTIFDLQPDDLKYAYKCECNIYKRCSNTNRAKANVTIKEMPLLKFENLSLISSNVTRMFAYCNEGAINTAQYFLIVLTVLVTSAGTFLLYLSYKRTQNEKKILIFGLIVAGLSLLVSIIIWINAQFFGKKSYVSVLIMCFSLFSCMVIWCLDLIFLHRFELVNGIKTLVYTLYLLEVASAILLFSANVYCTGESPQPIAADTFDYSYLELIGACVAMVISVFLTLAYTTIFFTLQEKNINEKINLTRLFKINRNFIFPSKSNDPDLRISSFSAQNSVNFETTSSSEQNSPNKVLNGHRFKLEPLRKHNRIKSDSSLLDKSRAEQLESEYLRSLQQSYTLRPQKTCFLPSVSSELDATRNTLNNETSISILPDTTLQNSRVSVRPSSKLSQRGVKETYIFFKKPLSKFTQQVHAKVQAKKPKSGVSTVRP